MNNRLKERMRNSGVAGSTGHSVIGKSAVFLPACASSLLTAGPSRVSFPCAVVPAKAGTHAPCAFDVARRAISSGRGGYGSPLSRGRQNSDSAVSCCHATRLFALNDRIVEAADLLDLDGEFLAGLPL